MPSGHSILAGYISIYMYYYLINKYKIEKKNHNYILIFSILFTFYTMYTRILFGCHTIQQTILGAAIGVFIGHYYYFYVIIYKYLIIHSISSIFDVNFVSKILLLFTTTKLGYF